MGKPRPGKLEKFVAAKNPLFRRFFKEEMAETLAKEGISLKLVAKKIKEIIEGDNLKAAHNAISMLFDFAGWRDKSINMNFTEFSPEEMEEALNDFIMGAMETADEQRAGLPDPTDEDNEA